MEKQERKKTAMMPASRRIAAGPEPFAYQHRTAKIGEKRVIPYQIIIYEAGLNPLNRIV